MSHSLKFRKDATLDQHQADEYAVVDPLAKNSMTLEEMRGKADNRGQRRYAGEDRGEPRASGSGGRDRDRDRRRDGGRSAGGNGGGYGGDRDRRRDDPYSSRGGREERADRPEVRGDWKRDRMDTSRLA